MKDKYHESLRKWQERNCHVCKFSDKRLVGTGKACCTYPGVYELDDEGECETRRCKILQDKKDG